MELTTSQKQALDYSLLGHNIAVLGQSGTGKTSLVRCIHQKLVSNQRTVSVTATTGIAALNIHGKTIHSWAGLMDGHFTNEELLYKLLHDERFRVHKNNILDVDCLIIDEISMLSAKLFSQLEFVCRNIRNNDKMFGGVQIILSGDFHQLPPVPNIMNNDAGEFCFLSCAWIKAITHKIILRNVLRQHEPDLIKAVHEISLGYLSHESHNLLKRMSRPLPPGPDPIRLCARNFDTDVYNSFKLMDVEGVAALFHATDEGNISKLHKLVVPKVLALKIGCPVMLLKNLSDRLVNGLRGHVVDVNDDCIVTRFDDIEVGLTRHAFTIYSGVEKKVIATRRQFPLSLSYAVTIHKAQGLTLERLEIDASNIFLPGQLGVAVGRAVCKKGLRILNFTPDSIMKHPDSLACFYANESINYVESLCCCREREFVNDEVCESVINNEDDEMSDFSDTEMKEMNTLMSSVANELMPESTTPPDIEELPFDPISLLKEKCMTVVETEQQKAVNDRCNQLTNDKKSNIENFTRLLNKKITELMNRSRLSEEISKSKDWTVYYAETYKYSTSNAYKQLVRDVCVDADSVDFSVLGHIFTNITTRIASDASVKLTENVSNVERFSCGVISDDGKGKIRYIGGRCVAKSKVHHMEVVRKNLHIATKRDKSTLAFTTVKMLDHMSAPYTKLKDTSRYSQTLRETQRKQHLAHGLTNISDEVFDFFMMLDEQRRALVTENNLNKFGPDVLIHIASQLQDNKPLKHAFHSIFNNFEMSERYLVTNKQLFLTSIGSLFDDIICRYCRIADDQLRKQLKSRLGHAKTERLRKAIGSKGPKSIESVSMTEIYNDVSENKQSTHYKLKSVIFEKKAIIERFSKADLMSLCKAYEIDFTPRMTKIAIVQRLRGAILDLNKVPKPCYLDIERNGSCDAPERANRKAAEANVPRSHVSVGSKRTTTVQPNRSAAKKLKDQEQISETFYCAACGRAFIEGEHWIQCDICDKWYDRYCLNIDDSQWNAISASPDDWYCDKCD